MDAAGMVDKLAAHFDREKPEWYHLIDLDRLDLMSLDCCVIAQGSGTNDYRKGHDVFHLNWQGDPIPGVEHNTVADDSRYRHLWVAAIEARRDCDAAN